MFDEFKNAFQKRNNAHVQLIIINVALYLILVIMSVTSRWTGNDASFKIIFDQFSLPDTFAEFLHRPWTLVTYFFTHSMQDIFHILFNMMFLYWFGKLFIEYLGSDKLIALYVLGGLAGGIVYLMAYNLIPDPPAFLQKGGAMVGASAAIFAIMVGAATLLPNYTFYLLFLGPVKIKYIAAFYILLSFIGTVGSNSGGNIAHLAGVVIGFTYVKQLQRGTDLGRWVTAILDWVRRLFSRSPRVKVTYRKTEPRKPAAGFNKATQEEIDVILDKISDRGYESLSKDEKEKLFNASKK